MKHFNKNIGCALLCLATGGSVFAQTADTGMSNKTEQQPSPDTIFVEYYAVILKHLDKDAVSLSFAKGSADLTAELKAQLDAMIPAINADKTIDKVVVASWSDQAYPAAKGAKLSDAQRKLADKRSSNIDKYLKDKGVANVDDYSMAERPNWLSKLFHMDEAQLKGAVKDSKTDGLNEEKIRQALESKGGPSKAVVFFKRQWKNDRTGS